MPYQGDYYYEDGTLEELIGIWIPEEIFESYLGWEAWHLNH
jgi:hypothetical protein